jgi:hypothetical protein
MEYLFTQPYADYTIAALQKLITQGITAVSKPIQIVIDLQILKLSLKQNNRCLNGFYSEIITGKFIPIIILFNAFTLVTEIS